MITVYRYTVPTILDEQWDGRFGLNMPEDAQILNAAEALRPPHNIGIFALVNTRKVSEVRRFLIVGVGDDISSVAEKIDPVYWLHIATIQSISSYVWNLFELTEG